MFAVSRKLIASKVAVATTRTAVRNFALAVRYHKHGDPEDVYKLEEIDPALLKKPLGADEVSLKFLAAPINPSDINIANGVYGTQPPLPAFGGNEGVAEVVQTGTNVTRLNKGDWVVPAGAPFGSWRQVAHAKAADVVKVPNDIPVAYAASLAINPATAYRMLEDFAQLKPGDWIIQNGANGMVGLAVLQLARERGIKTINIVREDRPDVFEALRLLDNLGGDLNWTDTFLGSASSLEILRELPGGVKLGLNCVGGETAVDMARVLNPGASLVTYGNMSKSALAVPEDLVAAKQLKLQGFWIADWFQKNSAEKKQAMLEDIAQKIREKQLTFFFEVHDFDDFAWALKKAQEPYRFRKVVLNLDYPDRMAEHDKRPESDYWIFDSDTNM